MSEPEKPNMSMRQNDQIFIRGQRVSCHIGVPDEERAQPQELVIHTTVSPLPSTGTLNDDVRKTIDYHAVYERVTKIAGSRPRKLIETLAEDLAAMVLSEFPAATVTIEIEKFILPGTQCVGVVVTREKNG